MVLFQGADNIFWFWVGAALIGLTVLAVWYATIIGRDRPPRRQRRGEQTIERYGDLEEDRAPVPKFLIVTYIGVALWAIGYAIWTGIQGLGS